jgi:hypothetical protein
VAVVLTLVQTKQIRINIFKRNSKKNTIQAIQNTVNTSTHITKTHTQLSKQPHITKPTHYKSHPYTHPHITKKLKQSLWRIHTKWNSHNTKKYPQYKVTLKCLVLLSPRNCITLFLPRMATDVQTHLSRWQVTDLQLRPVTLLTNSKWISRGKKKIRPKTWSVISQNSYYSIK